MSDANPLREARLRLITAEALKAEAEIEALAVQTRKITLEARAAEIQLVQMVREEASRVAHVSLAREYYFASSVSDHAVELCMETLSHWARRDPGQEITIIFNTPGGGVSDGLALFDFILGLRRKGSPVTTKGIGTVASMGAILMQAGTTRLLDKNAMLMIHEIGAGGITGKTSEIDDFKKLMERLEKRCLTILAERSTLTTAQIRSKWKRTDWWLESSEALDLGFVDAWT